ncbi:hypothetical protein OG520_22240 [Streptomyces sp. NBC_00984]|nr:hypothetical protein OG520_22240 [Streptomyces sp. NBC_00984]
MTYRERLAARRHRRILAALPPVTIRATEAEQRDPEWCHTHQCHSSQCQH